MSGCGSWKPGEGPGVGGSARFWVRGAGVQSFPDTRLAGYFSWVASGRAWCQGLGRRERSAKKGVSGGRVRGELWCRLKSGSLLLPKAWQVAWPGRLPWEAPGSARFCLLSWQVGARGLLPPPGTDARGPVRMGVGADAVTPAGSGEALREVLPSSAPGKRRVE